MASPNLKGSIQRAAKLKRKSIEIPEWPHTDDDGQPILDEAGNPVCTYWVRDMTLKERSGFDASVTKTVDPVTGDGKVDLEVVRTQLLVRTLCDESGQRLFTDDEASIIDGLDSGSAVTAFVAAQEVTGLSVNTKKS
jgi:hypothetical protein